MRTKLILIFTAVIALLIYFIVSPVVIDTTSPQGNRLQFQKGDVVRPFENFEFNTGNWEAFIILSEEDNFSLINKGKVLYTKNKNLLNKIKDNWVFQYSGADIATIQSKFLLYKNGNLMFSSNIVADKNQNGLQSINYGWLKSKNDDEFLATCKQFEKVQSIGLGNIGELVMDQNIPVARGNN